jgi:hypothetical protein
MPITLGILAQARQAPVAAGSYDLIESVVLGSTTASVTFSSLATYASTYKHLQIRMSVRTSRSDAGDNIRVQFNSDTGSNYRFHLLFGNGSSVASATGTNTFIETYRAAGNTATANEFGASVVDILDAFSTSKNTVTRGLGGLTSDPGIFLSSGLWLNTASLTSITLSSGSSFLTNSRFSLYGLKGA